MIASNETDDDLFQNFLKYEKYEISDDDDPTTTTTTNNINNTQQGAYNAHDMNGDDEFFDALSDSVCEKNGKRKMAKVNDSSYRLPLFSL